MFYYTKFLSSGISSQYCTTVGKQFHIPSRSERMRKPGTVICFNDCSEHVKASCITSMFCSFVLLVDVKLNSSSSDRSWQSGSWSTLLLTTSSACTLKSEIERERKPIISYPLLMSHSPSPELVFIRTAVMGYPQRGEFRYASLKSLHIMWSFSASFSTFLHTLYILIRHYPSVFCSAFHLSLITICVFIFLPITLRSVIRS